MKKKAVRFHPLGQSHAWKPHPLLMPLDPVSLPEVEILEFTQSWLAIWERIHSETPLTKAEIKSVTMHYQNRPIVQTTEDNVTTRLLFALRARYPVDTDLRRNIQMRAYALLNLMGKQEALGDLAWTIDGVEHYDPKLILAAALLPLDEHGHIDVEQAVEVVRLANERKAEREASEAEEEPVE